MLEQLIIATVDCQNSLNETARSDGALLLSQVVRPSVRL